MMDNFTPTQQAMLDILADGLPHPREELHTCLPDELGPLCNIRNHLWAIRKVLHRKGQDIICEQRRRRIYYRLIDFTGV